MASCVHIANKHTCQLLSSCQPPQCQEASFAENGRCFVCLRCGHISRQCHSRVKCPKCGCKVHVRRCFKGSDSLSSSNVQTSNWSLILSFQADRPAPTTTAAHSGLTSTQRSTLNVGAHTFSSENSHQANVFNTETPQKSQQVCIVLD